MRTKVRGRFVVALGAALALWATCPVKPAVVTGRSMDPTLRDGQAVLIDRWHYRQHAIQRGDMPPPYGPGAILPGQEQVSRQTPHFHQAASLSLPEGTGLWLTLGAALLGVCVYDSIRSRQEA